MVWDLCLQLNAVIDVFELDMIGDVAQQQNGKAMMQKLASSQAPLLVRLKP
jgi:hypothetical protein